MGPGVDLWRIQRVDPGMDLDLRFDSNLDLKCDSNLDFGFCDFGC